MCTLWVSKNFPEDNSAFQREAKFAFDGKPKMTKQFGFEISKSPKKHKNW
jgi:hypothetical protein